MLKNKPKKSKFFKVFKRKNYLKKYCYLKKSLYKLNFGFYGLVSKTSGILTFKQLESARRKITRLSKRKCKIWFRVSIDQPVIKKSKGARMGKGKGKFSHWCFYLRKGRTILEVSFLNFFLAKKALKLAAKKLKQKFIFISKVKKREIKLSYEITKYL